MAVAAAASMGLFNTGCKSPNLFSLKLFKGLAHSSSSACSSSASHFCSSSSSASFSGNFSLFI